MVKKSALFATGITAKTAAAKKWGYYDDRVVQRQDELPELKRGAGGCRSGHGRIRQSHTVLRKAAWRRARQEYLISDKGHLAFVKSANQTELLEKFNKTIAAMKQDGSLDKIVKRDTR